VPPNRDTPAMRQYAAFKKRHPDCVLFFRMGDFYEMFDDDAVTASRALGLTLTQRSEGIPMAGVPHHQLDTYLRRMIDAGFRVAVCDQIQDPSEARGVVERAVTRVITPGTLVEDALLDVAAPNHLASVCFHGAGDEPGATVGLALAELSTGRFTISDCPASDLVDELARAGVSELLFADAGGDPPPRVERVLGALGLPASPRPAWHYRVDDALEALTGHYKVVSLAGFGIGADDPAIPAAGALLRYLAETQALDGAAAAGPETDATPLAARLLRARSLAHLQPPRREDPERFLRIDAATLRALEVERTVRESSPDGALLGVLLRSGPRTAMGKRLLRSWLTRPSNDLDEIAARQDAVETLTTDRDRARGLDDRLSGVQDVARITARVGLGRASPRDLVALGASLGALDDLAGALDGAPALAALRDRLAGLRGALEPVAAEIARVCVDEPPTHLREGGLVRDGADAELDEARALQRDAGAWLAEYQTRLIAEHDLPNLKVGFNKVFGYYIELPRAQSSRAPVAFTRKQTLKNAERYITPDLKTFEDKVLSAGDRAVRREQELFLGLCASASARVAECAAFADTVAEIDVLAALARRAVSRGWVRPRMVPEPTLAIERGRHPVLEEVLPAEFVPNDTRLGVPEDDAPARLALITGPNMAGKSTYIRQVALIALLAHTGSFVPADAATIGVADRLLARIGADDALHRGQSTFMVEMVETANILHNATDRSIVILDEIGRGTSTLDGLSLAWAIVERLASGDDGRPTPRTLFATHYHELTELERRLDGRVANHHVAVKEWGDEIVFLHRIQRGRANRSYGIHVARLAGLPPAVVHRAGEVLDSLAVSHGPGDDDPPPVPPPAPAGATGQMPLFTEFLPNPVIEEIKSLDLDALSPLDAFDSLRRLRAAVERQSDTNDHE
jgi:DNA mismatch repair protein MutS